MNWTYMADFIKSRSVLIDFKPQNGFFIDKGESVFEICCCWFHVELCWSINTGRDGEWKKPKTWSLIFRTAGCVKYTFNNKPCKGASTFPLHQWPETNLLYLKLVHQGFDKNSVQRCKKHSRQTSAWNQWKRKQWYVPRKIIQLPDKR